MAPASPRAPFPQFCEEKPSILRGETFVTGVAQHWANRPSGETPRAPGRPERRDAPKVGSRSRENRPANSPASTSFDSITKKHCPKLYLCAKRDVSQMQRSLFSHDVNAELARTEHGGAIRRRRRKLERPVSVRRPMHV